MSLFDRFPNTVSERRKPHSHIGRPRTCSSTLLEGVVEINFAQSRGLYQTFALAVRVRITQILPVSEGNMASWQGKNTSWSVYKTTSDSIQLVKNSLGIRAITRSFNGIDNKVTLTNNDHS